MDDQAYASGGREHILQCHLRHSEAPLVHFSTPGERSTQAGRKNI